VPWKSAGVIVTDVNGGYLDANDAALELLGVPTAEDLRATPPGAFQPEAPDPDEEHAFRAAFLDAMFQGLIGEGVIRRLDGELVRVRTAIVPITEGFRILLYPVERPTTNLAPKVYKITDVLAEWRSAERRLVTVDPDSDEGRQLQAEVELLRDQYHAMFDRTAGSTNGARDRPA
jgi:PAS domain-containing protein